MVTEGTSEGGSGAPGDWEGLLRAWGWGPGGDGSCRTVSAAHVPGPSAWPGTCLLGPRDSTPGSLSFLIWKTRIGYSGCQSTGESSPRLPKHQTGVPQVGVPSLWLAKARGRASGSLVMEGGKTCHRPGSSGLPKPRGHVTCPGLSQDGLRQLGSRAALMLQAALSWDLPSLGPGDTAWH